MSITPSHVRDRVRDRGPEEPCPAASSSSPFRCSATSGREAARTESSTSKPKKMTLWAEKSPSCPSTAGLPVKEDGGLLLELLG
ncbi:hypothetical protein CERSUDRAFT_101467 [Gelatoporia subvermispora B]|uniref:Uncharacterized protein n=1 Tax=Ceriporiopsis subvermispora (strain B) TaxID=914234 RepID=M2P580_CERS8|nr:hypothetical protein CERSUDRAFT_101467 [Gelatoporia subvermispora B]